MSSTHMTTGLLVKKCFTYKSICLIVFSRSRSRDHRRRSRSRERRSDNRRRRSHSSEGKRKKEKTPQERLDEISKETGIKVTKKYDLLK